MKVPAFFGRWEEVRDVPSGCRCIRVELGRMCYDPGVEVR